MKILGIDLGVASVGWALIDDNKQQIIDSGVRIFTQSTNKDGKTLASIRRENRGARRMISRKKQRIKKIKQLLVSEKILTKLELNNLFSDKNRVDVWQLRAKGLDRKLTPQEWARVLYHIAKRRAYQSNRKADTVRLKADDDNKKVLGNISHNKQKMCELGYKTIGQMIYAESRYPDNRIRRNKGKDSKHKEVGYQNSISRDLLREEIDVLFNQQQGFGNPYCNDGLKTRYKEMAFNQLPIKFDPKTVGNCTFEKDETRGAKNSFSAEKSVLLSKINNTDLVDKNTGEIIRLYEHTDTNTLLDIFYNAKDVKYITLRKKLNISNDFEFKQLNYHQDFEYKTNIKGKITDFYKLEDWLSNEQKALLEKRVLDDKKEKFKRYKYSSIRSILSLSDVQKFNGVNYNKGVENENFGKLNGYYSIKKQLSAEVFDLLFSQPNKFNKIAEILSYVKDDTDLKNDFQNEVFNNLELDNGVIDESIDSLLRISFSGFHNLSIKAIDKLMPYYEQGLKYHSAAKEAYGHHSEFKNANPQTYLRPLDEQENYQITNPQIKRTFSQFRKVLNAVIRKHGSFDAMHIEIVGDLKNSKRQKIEIATGQKEFRQEKEALMIKFMDIFRKDPKKDSGEFLKLRLYEQQQGKCIYSEKRIDIDRLLEVGYVENDHILPKSRTFDNSLNNRALCLIKENQDKGNQTPFEYLANSDKNSKKWVRFKGYVGGISSIKQAKRNKLLNTTLPERRGNDLSEDDIEDPENGFLARNLNDTAYAARFIKNFVQNHLEFSKNDKIKQKVKVRTGALTDQLRHNWGIENKNRSNNLHHAEDAIILAFSTQSEVQRMSTIAARREDFRFQTAAERKPMFTPPFADFKNALDESIGNIFVSFAPRRKISGAAHKATIKPKDTEEKYKFPVNKGMAENGEVKRVDVFINNKSEYKFIVFYPADFYKDELPQLDLSGEELSEDCKFLFSLFKDDLIEFTTKKTKTKPSKHFLAYFKHINPSSGKIAYQQNFKSQPEKHPYKDGKEGSEILLATKSGLMFLKKYQVSVLGDYQEVVGEKRLPLIKQMRKNKSKNKK